MPKFLPTQRAGRWLALVALSGLLTGACATGSQEVYEVAPNSSPNGAAPNDPQFELPDPVPAVPAFAVKTNRPLTHSQLDKLEKIEGVAIMAPAVTRRVKVTSGKKTSKLLAAAVDPIRFRSVAPSSTRDADFIWVSLLGGEAVMTSEAARKAKIDGAVDVKMPNDGHVRVGAFAENGIPNFADLVVDARHTKDWGKPKVALVGAKTGVTFEALGRDIKETIHGSKLQRLLPQSPDPVPPPQTVLLATSSTPVSGVTGLNPTLQEAVSRLIAASNGKVWLVSGFRDHQRQYELWVAALQRYGSPEAADNWVAPPGSSMHERGLAVDLGGDLNLAVQLIQQMGLPLWRPMSWEAWHFELFGSRG
ncbi:MAG: hypothetical protein QOG54_1025 [Actinomycetota bacterium]|nr:hypothetical protein [Actinomycetota bacterium]